MNDWQERTRLLLGEKHHKLSNKNILIMGLGGVGGIAAEMLCRAGIQNMTIVDGDTIDASNLNRQIFTKQSVIDLPKANVLSNRLLEINPELQLNVVNSFVKDDEMNNLLKSQNFDYVIDAIDTLSPKVFLIYACVNLGLKVVSSMGSGGKLNPSMVKVDDISKSYNCSLARAVRKRLHRLGVRKGVKVVFSYEKYKEDALKFIDAENKKTTLGTISYMPSIFGIYTAWVVIDELIK